MANLLTSVTNAADDQEIHVVAAAVDGLLPQGPFTRARHGFSVCRGTLDGLLPGLWTGDVAAAPAGRGVEGDAALFFDTDAHLGGDAQQLLTCTLPLANTVFQNNRQSTLLASRWRRPEDGRTLELAGMVAKQTQRIRYAADGISRSAKAAVHIPFAPVTAPRVIAAGLGNIVRQINVDGAPTPASKELEDAVQELYDRWAARGHPLQGPLSVWALVIPPGAADEAGLSNLTAWREDVARRPDMDSELQATEQASELVVPLLRKGARVYRVRKYFLSIDDSREVMRHWANTDEQSAAEAAGGRRRACSRSSRTQSLPCPATRRAWTRSCARSPAAMPEATTSTSWPPGR